MVTHSSTVATTITPVTSSHRPTPTTGCPVPAPAVPPPAARPGRPAQPASPLAATRRLGSSSRSAVVICFLAAANTSPGGRVPGPPETDDGRVVGRIGRTAGHSGEQPIAARRPRPSARTRGSPAATAMPGPAPRRPAGRRGGASRTPSHAAACANSPAGAGELPDVQRGATAQPGSPAVLAVAEPAPRGQPAHVGERPVAGRPRRPAGRPPAARGCPARRRRPGSAPAPGTSWCAGPCRPPADLLGAHHGGAGQRVDQTWTCPRRSAEQGQRAAGRDERPQRVEPGPAVGAHREHRRARRDLRDLGRDRLRIGGQVRLGQHDQRPWRRTPRPGRAAARSGRGPVRVHRLDHRRRVHVRGEHLTVRCAAGGTPHDRRRRGSTASIVIRRSGQSRTTTQSPAQGSATGSRDGRGAGRPARLARSGPAAVSTVHTPRSTRVTRPGRWSGRACAA